MSTLDFLGPWPPESRGIPSSPKQFYAKDASIRLLYIYVPTVAIWMYRKSLVFTWSTYSMCKKMTFFHGILSCLCLRIPLGSMRCWWSGLLNPIQWAQSHLLFNPILPCRHPFCHIRSCNLVGTYMHIQTFSFIYHIQRLRTYLIYELHPLFDASIKKLKNNIL